MFWCYSRSVHLDLAGIYSTDVFISALQKFISIREYPRSIHSDNGTQIIANRELIKISEQLNMKKRKKEKKTEKFVSSNRFTWSFNRSSVAPWLNRSCESLLKSVKRSMQKAIGNNVLIYAELRTVLFEIASCRCDIEFGVYLSPNDLLLGTSNREALFGKF